MSRFGIVLDVGICLEETVSVKVLLVAKKQSLLELVPGRKGVNESL